MAYTVRTLEHFEHCIDTPDTLAHVKQQRDWLRKRGFDYSFIEWQDGLLALIVHPIDAEPMADDVRIAYVKACKAEAEASA